MKPNNFIDDVTNKIKDLLPNDLQAAKEDFANNAKAIMESKLESLNLVTREEFDVQAALLQKTRAKLEALEKKLADYEKK